VSRLVLIAAVACGGPQDSHVTTPAKFDTSPAHLAQLSKQTCGCGDRACADAEVHELSSWIENTADLSVVAPQTASDLVDGLKCAAALNADLRATSTALDAARTAAEVRVHVFGEVTCACASKECAQAQLHDFAGWIRANAKANARDERAVAEDMTRMTTCATSLQADTTELVDVLKTL